LATELLRLKLKVAIAKAKGKIVAKTHTTAQSTAKQED